MKDTMHGSFFRNAICTLFSSERQKAATCQISVATCQISGRDLPDIGRQLDSLKYMFTVPSPQRKNSQNQSHPVI